MTRAKPYVLIEFSIPGDEVETVATADLSDGWDVSPAGSVSQQVGDDWLATGKSLALRLPSTLVPEEPNFMINPAHPKFSEAVIGSQREFSFDPRLGL